MVVVLEEGGRSRDVDEEEENGGWGYLSSKKTKKNPKKNKLVSTQDEAGLATRGVSSAT